MLKKLVFALLLLSVAITAPAVQAQEKGRLQANESTASIAADPKALLQHWLTAVSAGKADEVASLYASNAVLLPTLSPKVLTTPESRLNYFNMFLSKPQLSGKIDEEHPRIIGDIAINSGLYTFTFMDAGKPVSIPARYTFIYQKTPNGWLIIEHHSSKLP